MKYSEIGNEVLSNTEGVFLNRDYNKVLLNRDQSSEMKHEVL
jgi:hypothetical protein